MKRSLLFTAALFTTFFLMAQDALVTVKVVDSKTLQPLPRASVTIGNKDLLAAYTNDSGEVVILFEEGAKRKQLTITMLGYETRTVTVTASAGPVFRVLLKEIPVPLPSAEVFPELPAHLFFGSKETQVLDYVVTPNYTLVALYNYYTKRCKLVLLDASPQVLDEQPIPADFEKFHISGLGFIYAVTPSRVYELVIRKGLIQMKYVTQDRFYKTIQYYCGGYNEYLYLTMRAKTGQIVIFFHENTKEKIIYQSTPFCVIKDEVTHDKALADLARPYVAPMGGNDPTLTKNMVKVEEVFPGYNPSEGDIIPGGFKTDIEYFKLRELDKMYASRPIYTPFFRIDSTLLIFDFYKNTATRYTYDTRPAVTDSITFHKAQGWGRLVFKNESDRFFTVYENSDSNLVVHALNTTDFSTVPLKELSYKEITNMKISGEHAYYLYQPDPKRNNVFLFRERLTP